MSMIKLMSLIKKIPSDETRIFIRNIFDCNINDDVANEIYRVIDKEKEFIKVMSPVYWHDLVKTKVFIMHGSNDSMVPFTESIRLNKYIKIPHYSFHICMNIKKFQQIKV